MSRRERIRSVLPPRVRDWTPGKHQVGLFIRAPDGATYEVCVDRVNQAVLDAALELYRAKGGGEPV